MNKRGYEFSAPMIVIAIGILILVYLYFLPVNDKCNLIPGLPVCSGDSMDKIIEMNPGFLVPQEVSRRYAIPNIELFRIDDLDIATLFNEASVSRGWFFSESKEMEFSAAEGAKDAKIFIFVNGARGSLNVVINGKTIARVRGDGIKQVRIPMGILKNQNTIRLIASVPFMPWTANHYEISKAVIKQSYTKTTNKKTYEVELKQDVNDFLSGKLNFDSECFSDGNLTVLINGNKVINDRACVGFDIDVREYLKKNNSIVFMTEGNYFINHAYLDVTIKDKLWPTYYFEVSRARLQNKKPIMLNVYFNETGNKELSIYVNGVSMSAQTNKLDWKTTMNRFLVEGQNSIMFVPKTEVTISNAEVG